MELVCSLAVLLCLSSFLRIAFAANVVGFNISRVSLSGDTEALQRLSQRQTTFEEITNGAYARFYQVDVTIGNPAQNVQLLLDTGSTDVWVPKTSSSVCSRGCATSFDPSKSSDFKVVLSDGFDIKYADGSESTGDYMSDTFGVGNVSLTLQMGLATGGTVKQGIMGTGYDTNEAASTRYPSLMDQMVANDFISAKAYSLWLNDLESSTGSILFGGIDTDKFTGALTVLPVAKNSQTNSFTALAVFLDSITIPALGMNLTKSSFPVGAILDSGTTLTYLPDDVATKIWKVFGAVDDTENTGAIWIECDSTSDDVLAFAFGAGDPIYVAASELILPTGPTTVEIHGLKNPCLFGISKSGSNVAVLGDTFLRSAYVVYHLGSNQIGIAQSNPNSTSSNIIEIPASGIPKSVKGAIPSSTAAPTGSPPASSTNVAATSLSAVGVATVTVTAQESSPTSKPTNVPSAPATNNHTVAIAVGVTVPVVLIAVGIVSFMFWWKRRNSQQIPTSPQPPFGYNQKVVDRSVRYS